MKSYNVKSNAKRVARQLVAKYPSYTADEPAEVSPGARDWYPALIAPTKVVAEGIPEEIAGNAYVNGRAADAALAPTNWQSAHGAALHVQMVGRALREPPSIQIKEVEFKPRRMGKRAAIQAQTETILDVGATVAVMTDDGVEVRGADVAKDITPADMLPMLADLPPRKESTPEEIEARRAERRNRIAKEKVEGTRTDDGKIKRETKSDLIVKLVSRANGATQAELETATGWQRHTLRGYIAGTLRKRGHAIKVKKAKGEETRYLIEAE